MKRVLGVRRRDGTFIRLGHRASFLLLLSIGYFGIASATIFTIQLRPDLFIFDYLPDWARFTIWLIGGTMAAVTALLSPRQSQPGHIQAWGFVGLCIPTAIRSVYYFLGLLQAIWDVNDRLLIISTGISGFIIYTIMLVMILLVASWPEPVPGDYLTIYRRPTDEQ